MVALADRERAKLAKFAEAIAQRVDRVAAGDRHQIGAVGAVGLVGAVERGPPVRGAADHRRRQHAADIALGDQILDVTDRRRHLALQSDRMADPAAFRRVEHAQGFVGVAAERPLAIDVLARRDRGQDRRVVVGHLYADRDQVDVGMPRELFRIGKRQRNSEMPRRRLGRVLARRAHRGDLEFRQRPQGGDVGDRGKPPARTGPDDPYPDFAAGLPSMPSFQQVASENPAVDPGQASLIR